MENNIGVKNRIKILALDFDGVITNLNIDWNSAIDLASQIAGHDVKSLLTFYENSHDSSIFQTVSREMEKLELGALKNAEPTPFVGEFLEKIPKNLAVTYIVSMQTAPTIKKFLHQHDMTGYFEEILTRERFPCKKAQIEYILKKSLVSPNELLLIDDSQRSITSCRELEIRWFQFTGRQNAASAKQMWDSVLDIFTGATSIEK